VETYLLEPDLFRSVSVLGVSLTAFFACCSITGRTESESAGMPESERGSGLFRNNLKAVVMTMTASRKTVAILSERLK
jgi:hypothetical protein